MATAYPYSRSRIVRFHAFVFLLVQTACAAQHEAPDDDVVDTPAPVIVADEGKQALVDGIKQVILSRDAVCPGDSIQVDVVPSREGFEYAIDGMQTESRTLQFRGAPSRRIVHVDAWPSGDRAAVRSRQVTIRVRSDCEAVPVRPELDANASWQNQREVKLTVRNPERLAATHYEWNFGDGSPHEITDVPAIDHVYAETSLAWQKAQSVFDVDVVAHTQHGAVRAQKSIVVRTHYARRKQEGVLQPPVLAAASWSADARTLSATVYNPERFALPLSSLEVRYQPCDGRDPVLAERRPLALVAEPESRIELRFVLPAPARDMCGVELYARGVVGKGRAYEVEVPLHAELRPNGRRTRLVTGKEAAALDDLAARGLVPSDGVLSDERLHLLERSRLASPIEPDVAPVLQASTPGPEQECAPGTVEAPPQPGWVCKATGTWVRDEPYLANAHTGDLVLSSSCGEIGMMLRALEVPQTFSHTGIMTQHYDAIRHSTALTKRFEDNRAGTLGAQGVVPEVLRFALPGTVSASVASAYRGMTWRDERGDGKDYRIAGFSSDAAYCPGDDSVVYPLVITGRVGSLAQRKAIAQKALGIDSHYRFYAYTRADISTRTSFDMPMALGGPSVATQCSSFIWTAAQQAGITLEGALEASDIALGAKTEAGILDGLYFYAAGERRAAAARMYSAIYNMVSEETGLKGKLVDAPDNWANQITNCFASDGCELRDKDSTAWKTVATVGRTVSPSDLLFWDEPYGRSEPIAYRVGAYRRRYVWQAAQQPGTLVVTVLDANLAPVSGAKVSVGDQVVATTSAGMALVVGDAGLVDVLAEKRVGDSTLLGRGSVMLVAGQLRTLTVSLAPPEPTLRSVRIDGTLHVVDDEILSDERATLQIHEDILINPNRPTATASFSQCAGDEVRAETSLVLTLKAGAVVQVAGTLRLYEGTSCDTGDREDTKSATVQLAQDAQANYGLTARNSGAGGGDVATLSVTVVNAQAR